MTTLPTGIYRHYKGKYYLVLGIAQHSETQERLVVYVPLYEHGGAAMSVRPLDMFCESFMWEGVKQKRFQYIGSEFGVAVPQVRQLVLDDPIELLGLNRRGFNCLKYNGIQTIGDLISCTPHSILMLKNMGRLSFADIQQKLAAAGFALSG